MLLLEIILIILEVVILIILFFIFKSDDFSKIVDCQTQQRSFQGGGKCLKCNVKGVCEMYRHG